MGPRARARWRQRRRDDAGASAVEFALLLPLFAMLTIGTISAGFAFHAWLNVTHGTQESARFAATLSLEASGGTATTWLTQVSERALAASNVSTGTNTAVPGTRICVAVVSPANIPALNAHMVTTTDAAGAISRTAALTGPCPGLTTMTGDYVQSTVSRPVTFNYVLGSADISVASTSVSRFEAVSLS